MDRDVPQGRARPATLAGPPDARLPVTDETPSAAETLRAAHAVLALQSRVSGRTRYLAGADPAAVRIGATTAEPPASALDTVQLGESAATPSALPTSDSADAPYAADSSTAAPVETAPPDALPSPPADSVPDLFGALPDPSLDPSLSPYERIEALIPEGSPLHAMTSLDEIRDYLASNVLTPIDEGRINPVLGGGDPHADLMIIGEAPGADEDRLGVPFVGRSGQLLDKILEAILFTRDDVYVSNILKSRPPGNRDPLAEEVAAHIPILYKQIALVRPKILLAVGKSAGNGLLGKTSSLANLRGSFQDFYGLPMLVTYHPAALLRNPQWKRPVWEDVKLLRTRYDQLTGEGDAG